MTNQTLSATSVQPWVVSDTGTFTVGRAHVVNIREMTRTFRSLDNRFGGGHAREYILLAGWMSYDAGLHGLGQRYMTQALRLALACDDRLLGAEILSGLSHQATYVRDNNGGIDLARAAGKTARERGHDALLAEAFVMEAHAHARAGDERACSRALTAAETTLDRADRQADPQWIGYFDEAYLAAKFGHCFKELRKPGPAKHFAQRSLDMNDVYIRGRAFNLALLANAHAQADEVETACAVGSQALDIIGGLRSARALDYIRDLLNEPFRARAGDCEWPCGRVLRFRTRREVIINGSRALIPHQTHLAYADAGYPTRHPGMKESLSAITVAIATVIALNDSSRSAMRMRYPVLDSFSPSTVIVGSTHRT